MSSGVDAGTVTQLLRAWRADNRGVEHELVPLIYDELRRIAASCLRREQSGHTLRPTDLVHEAFEKLCNDATRDVHDRAHFFAIAANTMRRLLIDHARHRLAEKRGGGERPIALDEEVVAGFRPAELVALDEALERLASVDDRKARVIELHYFAGMTREEIADLLGVHANTISRDLKLGQAWIYRELRGDPENRTPEL